MYKFLCLFASFLFVASSAYAWNLFGPKNYDQCVRQGLKDANTKLQLQALISSCSSEFAGEMKYTGEFDDDLKQCGVDRKFDYWLPIQHPKTRELVSQLTHRDINIIASGYRV